MQHLRHGRQPEVSRETTVLTCEMFTFGTCLWLKKKVLYKLPTLYVYFVAHFFCNAGLGISTHMFIPKINRSEGLLIACTAARIFFGKKYILFILTHMNKSMVAPMCFGHGCEQL